MIAATLGRKRVTRRVAMAATVIGTSLFVAVAVYAYFSATGSGTGLAITGGATFPAPLIDPAGAPDFSLTNMSPGDTATQTVTVTAPGAAGPSPTKIAIYEQGATGTQLSQLSLKVVEDGTTTIYDGPFATSWTASSPLVVPGNVGGGLWSAGEQHHLVFTVTFALTADNTFQSTSAMASFVWTRTQG